MLPVTNISTLQQTNASAKALAVEDQSRPNASIIFHSIHPSKHQRIYSSEETHNCRQIIKISAMFWAAPPNSRRTTILLQLQIVHISNDLSDGHNLLFIFQSPFIAAIASCSAKQARLKLKLHFTTNPRVNRSRQHSTHSSHQCLSQPSSSSSLSSHDDNHHCATRSFIVALRQHHKPM